MQKSKSRITERLPKWQLSNFLPGFWFLHGSHAQKTFDFLTFDCLHRIDKKMWKLYFEKWKIKKIKNYDQQGRYLNTCEKNSLYCWVNSLYLANETWTFKGFPQWQQMLERKYTIRSTSCKSIPRLLTVFIQIWPGLSIHRIEIWKENLNI